MGNNLIKFPSEKPFSQLTECSLSIPNEGSLLTLNADCLFHIFSYLELPDLVKLRTQCSTLNYVVCAYLPRLTTLSVVLSESKIENFDEEAVFKWPKTYKNITTKRLNMEGFVTIRKPKEFIEFINRYEIRNVERLTVIINDNSYFCDLPQLLELFPRVQVLFLDRARESYYSTNNPIKSEDLDCLFLSIVNLSSLNELFFFPCTGFHLKHDFSSFLDIPTASEKLELFELAIQDKLQIFKRASKTCWDDREEAFYRNYRENLK